MAGKENLAVLDAHPYNTLSTTHTTPSKPSGTTKVIDQLHSEIDELKISLESSNNKVKEYKQKYDVVTKRSTQVIENLTNTKHENDMMKSMLLRKERRIKDLEEQLTELTSKVDTLEFDQKSKQAKLEKLQDNEKRIEAEHRMLEISYETLMKSQKKYKEHYDSEVAEIRSTFEKYIKEREATLKQNVEKFGSNDGELVEAFKKMSVKSNKLEIAYRQKNNAIVEALKVLALAAKDHGNKTIKVLNECEDVLRAANRKLPNIAVEEAEGLTEPNKELDDEDTNTNIEPNSKAVESLDSTSVASSCDAKQENSTPEAPASLTLPEGMDVLGEEKLKVTKRNSRLSSRQTSPPLENQRNGSNGSSNKKASIAPQNSNEFVEILAQEPQSQTQDLKRRASSRRASNIRKSSAVGENNKRVFSIASEDVSEDRIETSLEAADESDSIKDDSFDAASNITSTAETVDGVVSSNRGRGRNARRGGRAKGKGNNRNARRNVT